MKNTWQHHLKADPVPWLLQSNPWTQYNTLTGLLDKPPSAPDVEEAKQRLLNDPQIQGLVRETSNWFPEAITRHNVPTLSHYTLMMLAEFGLRHDDPGIAEILCNATAHTEHEMFAVRQTLPQKGKGFDKPDPQANEWHALGCDTPILLYAFLRLGYQTSQVQRVVETLRDKWATPKGWFCHFFFVDGMFKKLNIGCLMAGLMALEVFSQIPELKESEYAHNAYAPLAFHREYGKSVYYFGRSKKFWTFKYPFVWYNALYLADVLTRFEFVKDEKLVKELIGWIEHSQDDQGRFKPTSMFKAYKGWDFANKKEPSPWITFLCCRILKQWYE